MTWSSQLNFIFANFGMIHVLNSKKLEILIISKDQANWLRLFGLPIHFSPPKKSLSCTQRRQQTNSLKSIQTGTSLKACGEKKRLNQFKLNFILYFRISATFSCPMNFRTFPADKQICTIPLESCKLFKLKLFFIIAKKYFRWL